MAQYNFDEGGNMAAYFVLSLLVLVLVPATLSLKPVRNPLRKNSLACECEECNAQRGKQKKSFARSLFAPKVSIKGFLIVIGWAAIAGLAHFISNSHIDTKLYDPFEILGIRKGVSEKEIKRHWRKLSLKFHPDKVKLGVNETMEEVAAKYVEFTKAYKSLTDETIRKNLEDFGHPDGRQEMSMGIAIPKLIVEGSTGMYFLLGYALLLGGSLPVIVGRWWFRSRAYTKDGVHAKSAETFFKRVKEDSPADDLIKALAAAWQYEKFSNKKTIGSAELQTLESEITSQIEDDVLATRDGPLVKRTLTLLYAHLLRLPVRNGDLRKELDEILVHCPVLLTSLLNVTLARNWLAVSIYVMQMHARLVQAVRPSRFAYNDYLQYPTLRPEELRNLVVDIKNKKAGPEMDVIEALARVFEERNDPRASIVAKAAERWCRLDVVDVYFKVIGDKIVTPSAFVNLVIKLRVTPPRSSSAGADRKKHDASAENQKKDEQFLVSRDENEAPAPGATYPIAHTPFWNGARRPQWWVLVGDDKVGRIIVPPVKLGEIPFSDATKERNYRTWKTVFQAPPQVGVFTWRLRFISDTFLGGDDYTRELTLNVEDSSLLDTVDPQEDEISDPDEDTLAGQLAAARGQKVKKAAYREESDDEESGTDDDESSESSSSDSD